MKASELLETVEPWLSVARHQWSRVQVEFEDFARLYSQPNEFEFNASHYGVVSYLERRDGRIDRAEAARLHALLKSKRIRLKATEQVELREVLKPLVAQVLINDLLRQTLQAPFIDWDDAQGFYDRLHLGQWAELTESEARSAEVASQSRGLFRMIVPELLPERIEDVVKFLRNRKAVVSLRHELWDLMHDGRCVSQDWMLRLQNEASKAQLRAEQRNRVIKWVGRLAGLVIPAAGVLGGLLLDAAEEGAEGITTHNTKGRFEWYYALQRIKMDQRPIRATPQD
jgi:hypothetical protein